MIAATDGISVGFAGMGRMGVPMARNLLAGDLALTVYNRTRERCRALAAAGASVADSPAQLGRDCDVVVTMLADGEAVREVLLGEEGVLAAEGDPGTVVEMSTIGPVVARQLAAKAEGCGWGWVDAPVSGSTTLAEQAKLIAMVGARPEIVARALPVLAAMTSAQFRVGDPGAGAAMKLALNLLIASSSQAISEGLVLAERSGIDREGAYEVIANSALASPFVDYKRAAFLDPDAEPVGFSLAQMQKDLDLALSLGRDRRVPLLAAAAAREGITLAAGLEGADQDLVSVADSLRTISAEAKEKTH